MENVFSGGCVLRLSSVVLPVVLIVLSFNFAPAQMRFSFEKSGKFIAPDQGLSFSTIHRKVSYEGPQPFDMLHYRLDVSVAMTSHALRGKITMRMKLKEGVDSLVLNALGLLLDTIRVDNLLKQARVDTTQETFTIVLGGRRNAGDTLVIAISYTRLEAFRRTSSRQGYYFFRDTIGLPANLGYTFSEPSDARLWFPCYDEPWEKATAEINITVPDGYVAASNGRLIAREQNAGTTTWRWRQDQPITTYLMCMTVSRFTISEFPYVKANGDTIPLQYYTWNAPPFTDSAWTAQFLPTVRAMVSAYAGLFGEYPFDKYGMTAIVPFGYLGMEHQTITTMNRYYATSHWVVSHELAHQWWGNNVTCGTWADIWLNESFATYGEALWREHLYGFDSLKAYMRDTLGQFYFVSWQGAIYNPVGQGFDLFTRSVYSKGGWVLHTLRGVLGDSLFFNALRAFQNRYRGQSAVTAELQAVLDSATNGDMSWFFNQWVYGRGWPKYASRYFWSGGTLSLTIQQQQDAQWPTFRMPIRVRAYTGTTHHDYVVMDSLRVQVFNLPLATSPDSVVIDPDGWILKQIVNFTDAAEHESLPSEVRLSQNYPNPFNPSTTILFRTTGRGHVRLTVFDLLGREVKTLVDDVVEAGEHAAVFKGEGYASGMYYYRLQAAGQSLVRKMILNK